MDQNIGRILAKLKEIGKDENTLILFVSDNGASAEMPNIRDDYGEIGTMTRYSSLGGDWANVANTPFRYYKNYSYEGGINTPFIAYWPDEISPKTISKFPGHFIDLMPTLVDITNAEYPFEYNEQKITPMQGQSLLPVFRGQNIEREKPLFWEWKKGQAAYSEGFKIVRYGTDEPWDLYNLKEDPVETTNLAKDYPEKLNELEKQFHTWKSSFSKN